MTGQELLQEYERGRRNFTEVNLVDASLRSANLIGARFVGATMNGADLTGANIRGCDFRRAILNQAIFKDCEAGQGFWARAIYPNCFALLVLGIPGALLYAFYSVLNQSPSIGDAWGIALWLLLFDVAAIAYWRRAQIRSMVHIMYLGATNFRGAKLCWADFSGANLRITDFRDASLIWTRFTDAKFLRTRFGGASDDGKLFEYLNLPWFQHLITNGRTPTPIFFDMELRCCNLCDADLRDANFGRSLLDVSRMERANLQGADLTRASLIAADLSGANLRNACLQGILIDRRTILRGAMVDHETFKRSEWTVWTVLDMKERGVDVRLEGFPQEIRDIVQRYEPLIAAAAAWHPSEEQEALIEKAHAALKAASTKDKGRLLEDLVSHLFGTVPGFTPTTRDMSLGPGREIDVVVDNGSQDPHWKDRGTILIDCRNRPKEPYGTPELNAFRDRMRKADSSLGFIVATGGFARTVYAALGEEKDQSIVPISPSEFDLLCTRCNRSHFLWTCEINAAAWSAHPRFAARPSRPSRR